MVALFARVARSNCVYTATLEVPRKRLAATTRRAHGQCYDQLLVVMHAWKDDANNYILFAGLTNCSLLAMPHIHGALYMLSCTQLDVE